MVVTNVNPCGTVTRRATSNLWQVLPKETERKLGSNVMDYLVAPKGYSIVGGDFDAQELGLATVLTDAQVGVVNSSPWTEMILNGDKNLGTDNHSVVAKRFKIPRNPIAKNVNFCLQYGGGLEKIALTIYSGTNDKTYEECLVLAKEYMNFMKGSNGIAKTTFDTLKKYGGTGGIRTMVLGVRIPESLDALWAQKRFTTTRNNWLIQSAGQDMLHLFHVGLWAYSIEYDLDYYPMLNIHDAAYFFVKKGQEELFKKCCQSIHYRLKATIYQQARKQAISLLGYGELTPDFTTPEKQQWFSSIKVGSRLSEV
jgi:DNA polymerase gamma 1